MISNIHSPKPKNDEIWKVPGLQSSMVHEIKAHDLRITSGWTANRIRIKKSGKTGKSCPNSRTRFWSSGNPKHVCCPPRTQYLRLIHASLHHIISLVFIKAKVEVNKEKHVKPRCGSFDFAPLTKPFWLMKVAVSDRRKSSDEKSKHQGKKRHGKNSGRGCKSGNSVKSVKSGAGVTGRPSRHHRARGPHVTVEED